tara:strand:+ start:23654 stop:24409 length:756 start_codon:yes stop_codon:yes gene_type:complete
MALNTTLIASEILNRVAAEVGIAPVAAPLASQDPFFIQLRYLLNTAGEELMQAYPWELLVRSHAITTASGDGGIYNMPEDFGYIINQTEWDRTNNIAMGGALTAQEWTYLEGRGLASNTMYASFRIAQGKFNIFPVPPPADPSYVGLDLSFEYISSAWVLDMSEGTPIYKQEVTLPSDTPMLDKTLITRAVKVKYLEAGGFDTTKAQADYNQIFSFLTGNDKGAAVINAGIGGGGYPYLSGTNTPAAGFGR